MLSQIYGVVSLLLLTAFVSSSPYPSPLEYGVGFSLASSYGTASIFFHNGTFIDTAKIDGDEQYQRYMRAVLNKSDSYAPFTHCHLPGWLCWIWRMSASNPLSPMIRALKANTEAVFKEDLGRIKVSMPIELIRYGALQQTIAASVRDASLKWYELIGWNGAMATRLALPESPPIIDDWSFNRSEYPPMQVVLTVEYTRSSLAAVFWEEDLGWYDTMRDLYSEDLGQASLEACRVNDYRTSYQCIHQLYDALHEFTEMPVHSIYGFTPINKIDWVFVFGESSDDPSLNQVLNDVLNKGYRGNNLTDRNLSPQTYSASRGAAKEALAVAWYWMENGWDSRDEL